MTTTFSSRLRKLASDAKAQTREDYLTLLRLPEDRIADEQLQAMIHLAAVLRGLERPPSDPQEAAEMVERDRQTLTEDARLVAAAGNIAALCTAMAKSAAKLDAAEAATDRARMAERQAYDAFERTRAAVREAECAADAIRTGRALFSHLFADGIGELPRVELPADAAPLMNRRGRHEPTPREGLTQTGDWYADTADLKLIERENAEAARKRDQAWLDQSLNGPGVGATGGH